MATENIPINSGTGPKVAVDLVGTDNYQAIKLMLGTDGSTAGGFWTGSVGVSVLPAISGSVSIINTPVITATVSVLPAVSGSVSVINTVAISGTVSATPLGTQDVNIVGGSVAGVQYTHTTTGIAATGTGTLVIGVQEGATTAQRLVLTTTGGLVIGSMPAVGGGQQYTHATTGIAATGTGTLVIGVQSGATTAQRLVLSTSGETLVGLVRTGTVNVVNVLSASGVTIASVATGTVNVVNVLSASGVTIASIATGSVTVLGTVAVSGTVSATPLGTQDVNIVGGSVAGKQYSAGATDAGATGTGTLVIGIQGTTSRAMLIDTTGGLIIASMPAVGGGQQYSAGSTTMANTATGSVILGIQSGGTTGRTITVTTTGWPVVSWGERLDSTNDSITIQPSYPINTTAIAATGTGVLVIGIQSGGTTARGLALSTTGGLIIASMPAVGGGQQYSAGATDMGATATGTVLIGVQSGGTTGRAIAVTATGAAHVNIQNVISASGITIASVTTGTMNVVNTVAISGTVTASLLATTASQVVIGTAHASRWDGYAVNTTSGASVIVRTSGAHTLYVTAMILSVDVPSRVDIFSAATTKLSVYLATKGGFTVNLPENSPMVLNSNQSLTFTPSASGSAMLWAAGYTVT